MTTIKYSSCYLLYPWCRLMFKTSLWCLGVRGEFVSMGDCCHFLSHLMLSERQRLTRLVSRGFRVLSVGINLWELIMGFSLRRPTLEWGIPAGGGWGWQAAVWCLRGLIAGRGLRAQVTVGAGKGEHLGPGPWAEPEISKDESLTSCFTFTLRFKIYSWVDKRNQASDLNVFLPSTTTYYRAVQPKQLHLLLAKTQCDVIFALVYTYNLFKTGGVTMKVKMLLQPSVKQSNVNLTAVE